MFISLFLSTTNYQPLSMWQHSRFQTYAKNILCSMISSNSVAVGWTARSDAVVESTTFAQSVTVKTLQQQDPEPGSSVRINLALLLKDSINQIEQALQLLTNWHFHSSIFKHVCGPHLARIHCTYSIPCVLILDSMFGACQVQDMLNLFNYLIDLYASMQVIYAIANIFALQLSCL